MRGRLNAFDMGTFVGKNGLETPLKKGCRAKKNARYWGMPKATYISHIVYVLLLLMALSVFYRALAVRKDYVRILFIYLVVQMLFEVVIWGRVFSGHHNNMFLPHIFTPIECILVFLMYMRVLTNWTAKRAIGWSIVIYIPVCFIFSCYIQKLDAWNSYDTLIGSLMIICWALLFLREMFFFGPATGLMRYPLFWINAGTLIYFTECALLASLPQYLLEGTKFFPQLWLLDFGHSYLYLIFLTAGGISEVASAVKKQKPSVHEHD